MIQSGGESDCGSACEQNGRKAYHARHNHLKPVLDLWAETFPTRSSCNRGWNAAETQNLAVRKKKWVGQSICALSSEGPGGHTTSRLLLVADGGGGPTCSAALCSTWSCRHASLPSAT